MYEEIIEEAKDFLLQLRQRLEGYPDNYEIPDPGLYYSVTTAKDLIIEVSKHLERHYLPYIPPEVLLSTTHGTAEQHRRSHDLHAKGAWECSSYIWEHYKSMLDDPPFTFKGVVLLPLG